MFKPSNPIDVTAMMKSLLKSIFIEVVGTALGVVLFVILGNIAYRM